jgi:hypothetical protein
VGVAAAVDFEDTQTNSYLDGNATATGDIDVEANMSQGNVPLSVMGSSMTVSGGFSGTGAQAGVGSASKGDMLADAKSSLTAPATSAVKSVVSKIQTWITGNEPTAGPQAPADFNSSFDLSAAFGVAVDLDSTTARIGDGSAIGGVVSTQGNVNVLSCVAYNPSASASSSTANNPDTAANNKSNFSGSVAISFGYNANDAQAYINTGARVDALQTITVQSQALNDFSIAFGMNLYDALTETPTYTTSTGSDWKSVQSGATPTIVQVANGYTGGGDPGYW